MATRRIFYVNVAGLRVYVDAPDSLSSGEWSSRDNGDGTYTVRQLLDLADNKKIAIEQDWGSEYAADGSTVIGVRAYGVAPRGGARQTAVGGIELVSGGGQSGTVGTTLAAAVVFRVLDPLGQPVQGATVNFVTSLGETDVTSDISDAAGLVSVTWTLDTLADTHSLLGITANGYSTSAAGTAVPDALALLIAVSGDNQVAEVGTALPDPFVVQGTDQYGNLVADGTTIDFAVTAGAGSLDSASADTVNGEASVTLTLGAAAGTNTVQASSNSITLDLTASGTATAQVPAAVAITSGKTQASVTAGSAAAAIVATVTDDVAAPVEGVTVRAAITSGGGSLNVASAVTDVNGHASFTYTTLAFPVQVASIRISADGVVATDTASITSVPGTATKLGIVTQPPTNALSGAVLTSQPQVDVRDANNNRVTGDSTTVLTVAIGTGNGTLSPTGSLTATVASGLATFSGLILNDGDGGTDTLHFTSPGLTGATSNAINVTPPVPSKLAQVRAPADTVAGQVMSPGPQFEIQDAGGARVPGDTSLVTVALDTNPGGGGTLGGTLSVNAIDGTVTFSNLVAGGTVQAGYVLRATSGTLQAALSGSYAVLAAGSYPNEPAGYVTSTANPCISLPVAGAGKDAYGWYDYAAGHNTTIVDPTVMISGDGIPPGTPPSGESAVWRTRWTPLFNGGGGPEHYQHYPISGTDAQRGGVYYRAVIWLDTAFSSGNTAGVKFCFLNQSGGGGYSDLYPKQGTGALGVNTEFTGSLDADNRNMSTNYALKNHRGEWLTVEWWLEANTVDAVGQYADGKLTVWVNGVVVLALTDANFFDVTQAHRWEKMQYTLTYGGGNNHPGILGTGGNGTFTVDTSKGPGPVATNSEVGRLYRFYQYSANADPNVLILETTITANTTTSFSFSGDASGSIRAVPAQGFSIYVDELYVSRRP